MPPRSQCWLLGALFPLLFGPALRHLGAQPAPDARLLEASHWAYEYLARLRGRGYLADLDPLAQPYTRADVARALARLAPDSLRQPVAGWVRLLRAEFLARTPPSGGARVGALAWAGLRAATSRRFDPLRAMESGGAWPSLGAGGWITAGHLAAETRVLGDTYLRHDPDGRPPHLPFGGISDHTYVSLGWPGGAVTVGRLARNWAPPGTQGLLLSANPLSYPQVAADLRLGPWRLEALTAQLDTLGGSRRFLAANRLAYVRPGWGLAFTEALLYSSFGSGLSLQLLNPFTILAFESENPPDEGRASNLMLGLDFWYGTRSWEVSARGLLDDIDVHPDSQFTRRAPTRYAAAMQATWHPQPVPLEASIAYERVSSYAYRSYELSSSYQFFGRGLGTNFADYDQLTLGLLLFPALTGLQLGPSAGLLRQGEGDWRIPFPPEAVFRASPDLFLGVVERTYRVGLTGRYQPRPEFWVRWDVGQNWIHNAGHVLNRNAARLAAFAEVGMRLDFSSRGF